MNEIWLLPNQVFDGQTLRQDTALHLVNHQVQRLVPASDVPVNAPVRRLQETLAPGFLDLQVNGGGGVLLNASPTAQAMRDIAAAHRALGTVAILPTVISDAPDTLNAAVEAALSVQGETGLLGLHIEGPHLSETRRGTHAASHLRPMDQATLHHVQRLRAAQVPVMITLAPEMVSLEQISALAATGAVVSVGHSDATAEQTRAALDAGATAGTHLFNAMSPMLNRSPGVVGALINSDAFTGIIVDGQHVAEEMIALAIRARPVADRVFLVSDAMPTVGGPDRFRLYGQDVCLRDGRLINKEGSLAGAHLWQGDGLHRLINRIGIDPAAALRMAISIPAQVMGLDMLSQLEGRPVTDLIRLDDEYGFVGFLDYE